MAQAVNKLEVAAEVPIAAWDALHVFPENVDRVDFKNACAISDMVHSIVSAEGVVVEMKGNGFKVTYGGRVFESDWEISDSYDRDFKGLLASAFPLIHLSRTAYQLSKSWLVERGAYDPWRVCKQRASYPLLAGLQRFLAYFDAYARVAPVEESVEEKASASDVVAKVALMPVVLSGNSHDRHKFYRDRSGDFSQPVTGVVYAEGLTVWFAEHGMYVSFQESPFEFFRYDVEGREKDLVKTISLLAPYDYFGSYAGSVRSYATQQGIYDRQRDLIGMSAVWWGAVRERVRWLFRYVDVGREVDRIRAEYAETEASMMPGNVKVPVLEPAEYEDVCALMEDFDQSHMQGWIKTWRSASGKCANAKLIVAGWPDDLPNMMGFCWMNLLKQEFVAEFMMKNHSILRPVLNDPLVRALVNMPREAFRECVSVEINDGVVHIALQGGGYHVSGRAALILLIMYTELYPKYSLVHLFHMGVMIQVPALSVVHRDSFYREFVPLIRDVFMFDDPRDIHKFIVYGLRDEKIEPGLLFSSHCSNNFARSKSDNEMVIGDDLMVGGLDPFTDGSGLLESYMDVDRDFGVRFEDVRDRVKFRVLQFNNRSLRFMRDYITWFSRRHRSKL